MAFLEITDIIQRYGSHTVIDGARFTLEKGTIACLLGPSGCGKTTLLRCIAGFETVTAGEIRIEGLPCSRPNWSLPTEQRKIGMVFQDYALFPHLNVAGNIGFGLSHLSRAERQCRIEELLSIVGLEGRGKSYPHELSGGQQQRVALARALAPNPRLILLDEPFSNLDTDLRERLSLEVRDILKRQHTTAILVTHDQHEAFAMADEIGLMMQGRIQQWDTPYNLYHHPINRQVADFIGQGVLLPGKVCDAGSVMTELGRITSRHPANLSAETAVDVLLRPDDLCHDESSPQRATVLHRAFRGAETLYTLRLDSGTQLLALVPSHHDHTAGTRIGIRIDAPCVVAFERPSTTL
ncbi:MAG: ABC transporter ATP-binding protein [Sterolibacterium sp.]|nr:ABC transporter ATP-binding protein [Sterolibacterium sp.]MBP9798843.1 ABC transporter ATP-binding protein [Sterolibacterium sp.]